MSGQVASAKVNLFLHVLGRRNDGYHELESLVAFADFGDELSVEARENSDILLETSGPFADALADLPPAGNLVYRAAKALAETACVSSGVSIRLQKDLPVAAGIGGGSADAAATLKLLIRHWDLDIPKPVLDGLARDLGADVPVCLESVPSFVGGAGERVEPLATFPDLPLVLVNPGIPLATADVFAMLSPPWSHRAGPPSPFSDRRGLFDYLMATRNDLESGAIALAPVIEDVLARLRASKGCRVARMSGSGATCFGLFDDPASAGTVALSLERRGWWSRAGMLVGTAEAR